MREGEIENNTWALVIIKLDPNCNVHMFVVSNVRLVSINFFCSSVSSVRCK